MGMTSFLGGIAAVITLTSSKGGLRDVMPGDTLVTGPGDQRKHLIVKEQKDATQTVVEADTRNRKGRRAAAAGSRRKRRR